MSISLQKASFLKRISAYILDAILVVILSVGFAAVLSFFGFDRDATQYEAQVVAYQQEYAKTYGIDLTLTQEEIQELPAEEQQKYEIAGEAWRSDPRVIALQQLEAKLRYLMLAIIAISVLLACLIVFFIIPLCFKNGQTVGKKVFGLAVMRSNCVKVSNPVLFVRSILGLYTMEIMVPIFLILLGTVGVISCGLLLLLEIVVICATHTNSSIHDLLSDTVVVDMASQQIFESEEELLNYKKAQHAEEVAESEY